MRSYETMFIVHPDTGGDQFTAVLDKFKGILADQNATMLKVEEWGSRRLAYPIQKQGRGTFVIFFYEATAAAVSEYERRMRLDETIMRYQTVRYEPGSQVAPAAPAEAGEAAEVAEEEEAD